jgi:hypothetical protein
MVRRDALEEAQAVKLKLGMIVAFGALIVGNGSAAADHVTWGVNDDAGKYEGGNGPFWSALQSVGMTSNTITLRWDETSQSGFEGNEVDFVAPSLAAASAAGVSVAFDVYPRHSTALADPANAARFATWVAQVAAAFPEVKEYVVMNECNTSLFVNPQYVQGRNVSAARCGAFLAATYDALKAVDPAIFVWGLGLSPRGNPVPTDGSSPRATDPLDWLSFLGGWYRGSGRAAPLMDGVDLHPYPLPQNLPFELGYSDPTAYSVSNLPRAYQAFYDAFNGTFQPTVGPGRLPVSLNEVGIQTAPIPGVAAAYSGVENADGISAVGSEAYQAQWYRKLIDFALCDADVTKVNIFKLVDETQLEGWQSGLFYAGYVPKLSATVFAAEVARTAGVCPTGTASTFVPSGAFEPGAGSGGSPALMTDQTSATLATELAARVTAVARGLGTNVP